MADQFRAWKAWPEIQSFSRRQQPSPARRRRAGDPHGRPGLTSKNCDRSHTHTYTSKRVSHSHLTPWSPPSPLPDGPFKLPALGPARAPGNAGYSAFQHKKRRTKSRRACAEAAPRAVATTLRLVRPGEATVILAYHSDRLSIARDRFEVLGVRGDINKSTFGTEDKCNPLEAIIGAALRYQTLRSLTATEIGAAPRLRHVTQGGGVVVSDRHAAATSHGGHGERIDLTVMIQSRPRGTVTAKP